jgi:hypothetical protein
MTFFHKETQGFLNKTNKNFKKSKKYYYIHRSFENRTASKQNFQIRIRWALDDIQLQILHK